MAGFIYIMSNSAFPNLLKIGKSTKDPTKDRVSELNQTGVPEPFKVEHYALVEDETYLEQKVHDFYRSQRPNMNREFFTIDCAEAINTIRNLAEYDAQIKYEEVFYPSEEEIEPAIKGLESGYNRHEHYQAQIEEQDGYRINKAGRLVASEEYEKQNRKNLIQNSVLYRMGRNPMGRLFVLVIFVCLLPVVLVMAVTDPTSIVGIIFLILLLFYIVSRLR